MSDEAKTTETGIAISTFTQADIPKLLEKVNEQIRNLTKDKKPDTIITKPLPGIGDVSKIDDLATLLRGCASVEKKQQFYDEAATKYLPEGIKPPPFLLAGYSSKTWLEYLAERIAEVSHKKELEKLLAVKSKLEENLSAEAKLANDLKAISDLLTKD